MDGNGERKEKGNRIWRWQQGADCIHSQPPRIDRKREMLNLHQSLYGLCPVYSVSVYSESVIEYRDSDGTKCHGMLCSQQDVGCIFHFIKILACLTRIQQMYSQQIPNRIVPSSVILAVNTWWRKCEYSTTCWAIQEGITTYMPNTEIGFLPQSDYGQCQTRTGDSTCWRPYSLTGIVHRISIFVYSCGISQRSLKSNLNLFCVGTAFYSWQRVQHLREDSSTIQRT